MKNQETKKPPNMAARALRSDEFRQRVVKGNQRYSRKDKHKKREGQQDGLPSFDSKAFVERHPLIFEKSAT